MQSSKDAVPPISWSSLGMHEGNDDNMVCPLEEDYSIGKGPRKRRGGLADESESTSAVGRKLR
jgi:hypothetical protein